VPSAAVGALVLLAGPAAIAEEGTPTALDLQSPEKVLDAAQSRRSEPARPQPAESPEEAERAAAQDEAAAREAQQEARLKRRIDEQLRVQEALMRRTKADASLDESSGPVPTSTDLETQANSRIAPPAPGDRQYPPDIFDSEKVTVPAGQWGNRRKLELIALVLDADADGKPELVRYVAPESKLLVRQEEDSNYDGVTDAWSDYEWGAVVARVLDSNDDGNPDVWERYENGFMTSKEVDRDDDGVRDAFHVYKGRSLVLEKHDVNNDGRIDRIIYFENRRRVRSEDDLDTDGRMDTWTTFTVVDGVELVSRIERDSKGRGSADTFEFFEPRDGKAVIRRRDQDIDGDGRIDIVSYFRNGKLVRRQISDPDLVGKAG
jgi:hypothetical protein